MQKIVYSIFLSFVLIGSMILLTHTASAHEVYVLSPAQINQALGTQPFDMIGVVKDNMSEFVFWAFISILTIFVVFFISVLRFLEKWLDPFFLKLRPYAPFVARVTVGLSFLAAAYYQASYGPELPLLTTYGSFTGFITTILIIVGILIIIGFYARIAAIIALVMYGVAVWLHGWYMLTYVNYLGEIIVLLLLGAHNISLDKYLSLRNPKPQKAGVMTASWKKMYNFIAPKSFAILRVCFGISLIFASAYAKVIHNNLGLMTVEKYHLDTVLGFEPHFLVLGAAIIEILIGTFVILGIEIRFTALFFEFWLIQSLLFFGEAVWPHIILIGIPIALFMYGYDSYSLEGFFFRKKKYEPVL